MNSKRQMWKDVGTAILGIGSFAVLVVVMVIMWKLGQPMPPGF